MDLLALAKTIADRVEIAAARAEVPLAVSVIDTHGNVILKHRMSGASAFSIELSERKAYTSALVGMRNATGEDARWFARSRQWRMQERDQKQVDEFGPHQPERRCTHKPHQVMVVDPDDRDE